MPIFPTLLFSFPDWGKGSSLSQPDVSLPALNPNLASMRRPEIVGDHKGVDGVIFEADSQAERMEANIEAMHNLYENPDSYGYDLTTIPFAVQYNKRDLPNAMSMADLRAKLNPMGMRDFEGVAIEGRGVLETLGAVSKLVVQALS